MSASIAGQQTSEFNDLNPPDSGDKPPKARESCVVKSAELFCYTVVVVTDKTGAQSEFQLMQVSLVCSAGFNCNHSCSLCKCKISRVETRYCWSRGIGTSECFSHKKSWLNMCSASTGCAVGRIIIDSSWCLMLKVFDQIYSRRFHQTD